LLSSVNGVFWFREVERRYATTHLHVPNQFSISPKLPSSCRQ
jgi:hypothetical protein